ncbi:hypothetical protein ACJX0J_038304 [Zea mays]
MNEKRRLKVIASKHFNEPYSRPFANIGAAVAAIFSLGRQLPTFWNGNMCQGHATEPMLIFLFLCKALNFFHGFLYDLMNCCLYVFSVLNILNSKEEVDDKMSHISLLV